MQSTVSQSFHRASYHDKEKLNGKSLPHFWRDAWDITYYKSYPRLEKVKLSPEIASADFFKLIRERSSERNFKSDLLNKKEISLLLRFSCGNTRPKKDGRFGRAQPSAGGRYPLETYLILPRGGEDIESGIYHYNVKEHSLDVLWKREFSSAELSQWFIQPQFENLGAIFLMTAVFWRNQDKYGERGYRQILIEAGHIGQNLYLASGGLGLKCCAVSGTIDETFEELLDIDGATESLVYAVVAGK